MQYTPISTAQLGEKGSMQFHENVRGPLMSILKRPYLVRSGTLQGARDCGDNMAQSGSQQSLAFDGALRARHKYTSEVSVLSYFHQRVGS